MFMFRNKKFVICWMFIYIHLRIYGSWWSSLSQYHARWWLLTFADPYSWCCETTYIWAVNAPALMHMGKHPQNGKIKQWIVIELSYFGSSALEIHSNVAPPNTFQRRWDCQVNGILKFCDFVSYAFKTLMNVNHWSTENLEQKSADECNVADLNFAPWMSTFVRLCRERTYFGIRQMLYLYITHYTHTYIYTLYMVPRKKVYILFCLLCLADINLY